MEKMKEEMISLSKFNARMLKQPVPIQIPDK